MISNFAGTIGMKRRLHLECDERGVPMFDFTWYAYEQLKYLKWIGHPLGLELEVSLITPEDRTLLSDKILTKDDIFLGSIDFVRRGYKASGFTYFNINTYLGSELYKDAWKRKINVEYLTKVDIFPSFVKPLTTKQFPGTVVEKKEDLLTLAKINKIENPETTLVYTSPVIKNILYEYRIFVLDNECIGWSLYNIDDQRKDEPYNVSIRYPTKKLCDHVVQNYVADYMSKIKENHFPVSYVQDMMVHLSDDIEDMGKGIGERVMHTSIVEFNGILSSGLYGAQIPRYIEAITAYSNTITRAR
jgi:hypothetical protein